MMLFSILYARVLAVAGQGGWARLCTVCSQVGACVGKGKLACKMAVGSPGREIESGSRFLVSKSVKWRIFDAVSGF